MDVITSKGGPELSADVLSHSATSHEFHCEKAWQNIIPTLELWLTELSGLQVSFGNTQSIYSYFPIVTALYETCLQGIMVVVFIKTNIQLRRLERVFPCCGVCTSRQRKAATRIKNNIVYCLPLTSDYAFKYLHLSTFPNP